MSTTATAVTIPADLVKLLRAAALDALDELSGGLDRHTLGQDDGSTWQREAYGAAFLLGLFGDSAASHDIEVVPGALDLTIDPATLGVGARDALPTVFEAALDTLLEGATIAKQDGNDLLVEANAEAARRVVMLKADLTSVYSMEV